MQWHRWLHLHGDCFFFTQQHHSNCFNGRHMLFLFSISHLSNMQMPNQKSLSVIQNFTQ
uniref:Uncharacterized protein n=1 Tax=Oryza brachyantha TaxID=4533 RepID=J3LP27_ORYBR